MNHEFAIARRIHFRNEGKSHLSKPAVRIATTGIALGLCVMIIAVAVVVGFKQEVRNKLIGFGAHIQVTALTNNSTYETPPIAFSQGMLDSIAAVEGVKHIERYATKPAILKTSDNFEGVVLKGVESDYDWTFFSDNLVEGTIPVIGDSAQSTDIIISRQTASKLGLKSGDAILAYFIQDNIKVRKLHITGIYSSGLGEFDRLFIIGDMRIVQSLNKWESDEASGLEILIDDWEKADETAQGIFAVTANRFDRNMQSYYTRTIAQIQPNIFAWLGLLDLNVIVILILMMTVAGFNMISGLLILILDKTNMIGTLKALGSRDWSIRRIFLYQSAFLIIKGLLWGNIIGLGLTIIQMAFHVIPLDSSIYFVEYVPVIINPLHVLALNIMAAAAAMLMILVPSHIIARISPSKAIRFD